ncbi:MAG: ATP-binding cassette domain-containing protein [Acidimicrobiia bacterium]
MLVIEDLHKSFGDIHALNGCSLSVERGRMLGFLGPNGAGKTTTMRSIFGLIRPDSGTVTWDGQDLTRGKRMAFGYMPEERGLYPKMKAHDQLTYLGRIHGLSKTDAANAAGMWLDRLGLEDRHDSPLESLSHGNQQRVQLAAALIHDPELLVLDEPFAGLDPIAAETMADVLNELTDLGRAVIFSSHQLDVVEDMCEDVAIINEGAMVVTGTVKSLKDAAPIRHLELEVDGDAQALLDTLDGVRSTTSDGTRHTVIIDAETDVRGFLSRAQDAGRVRHFSYTTPSLSDLFREAVK